MPAITSQGRWEHSGPEIPRDMLKDTKEIIAEQQEWIKLNVITKYLKQPSLLTSHITSCNISYFSTYLPGSINKKKERKEIQLTGARFYLQENRLMIEVLGADWSKLV